MEVRSMTVFGAGVMGHGIAQVAALSAYEVTLLDTEQARVDAGVDAMQKSLARMLKAGRISADELAAATARLRTGTDVALARDADLVIEAITENYDLKRDLFRQLDEMCRPDTVLTSNTSQFPITSLAAAAVRHPERVCGMHFFNPPQVMRLVEIARAVQTGDEAQETVVAVARRMGKEVVLCQDSQGFITSRLIALFMNEALRILEEGVATREDIDRACRLAFNHPMGPLELLDLTGGDTVLYVLQSLTDAFGDRFRPTQVHRNLVRAGYVGRKSGRGMYRYQAR